MKIRKRWIALLLFAGLIAFAVSVILNPAQSFLLGFDRKIQRQYESIENGWTRERVTQLLGLPEKESVQFCLPQRIGYEDEFEAAEKTNAVSYCRWHNGGNWFYCVGFDSEGRVVIKAEGHS